MHVAESTDAKPCSKPCEASTHTHTTHTHTHTHTHMLTRTRTDKLTPTPMRTQVMHGSSVRLSHLFCTLPTTFVLPKEAQAFTEAFHKASYGVELSVTQPKGLNLW